MNKPVRVSKLSLRRETLQGLETRGESLLRVLESVHLSACACPLP